MTKLNKYQINELTNKQLNEYIAEKLGWTNFKHHPGPTEYVSGKNSENVWSLLPDYISNTNLIYEIVANKPSAFQVAYANNILNILGHHDHVITEAINAKPRTRAEALLLTLNNL